MKRSVLIIVLVILGFAVILAGYSLRERESSEEDIIRGISEGNVIVNGTIIIPEHIESFENAKLEIILFEYEKMMADILADRFDEISIEVSHEEGTETVRHFEFYDGGREVDIDEKGYYISARGYLNENYFLFGECKDNDSCGVIGKDYRGENYPTEVEITFRYLN